MPAEVAKRVRAEHAAGRTLGQIARGLDADQIPTAQGGRRWWPSSVRVVLIRWDPALIRLSVPPSAVTREPRAGPGPGDPRRAGRHAELLELKTQPSSLAEALEGRKTIEHAKGILM